MYNMATYALILIPAAEVVEDPSSVR